MAAVLQGTFERVGVGLHSGDRVRVKVSPAPAGCGRYFVRTDLPGQPIIPAHIQHVHQTTLSTELKVGDATVRTVEHLLAALAGMGIADARIEVDGAELPLLDGSALEWVNAIQSTFPNSGSAIPPTHPEDSSSHPQPSPSTPNSLASRTSNPLSQPLTIHHEDAFVAALPSSELRFTYGIDFDLPAIGNQWFSWSPTQEKFEVAIAPARTFALAHQIEQLRAMGLIKGGSLENALVCDRNGWLNPPLRFSNEPVRHKLLDLVGDLSLLGPLPTAHFLAYKASHQLHTQLAHRLANL